MYSRFTNNSRPKDKSGISLIQSFLNHGGYTGLDGQALRTDGVFGANTEHAVQQFQARNGLVPTGEVDTATRAVLGGNFAPNTSVMAVNNRFMSPEAWAEITPGGRAGRRIRDRWGIGRT